MSGWKYVEQAGHFWVLVGVQWLWKMGKSEWKKRMCGIKDL
jgi:hypothetical protein